MNSEINYDLKRWMEEAIRRAGGEIKKLIELSRVSRKSISIWKDGKGNPTRKKLKNISKAVNLPIEWLEVWPNEENITHMVKENQSQYKKDDDINSLDLLKKAADILGTETIYRQALASNINSFHQAIETDKDNRELKTRLLQIEGKNSNLEKRLAQLEAKLAQGWSMAGSKNTEDPPEPATGTGGM